MLMAQCAPTREEACRWNSAAMRRSSCSTMPISTPPSTAPWLRKYRNTGQTCVCANRLLVQDGVYDAFASKLADGGREAEGRQRPRGGRRAGPADRRGGARQGRGAHRRRARQRAQALIGGKRHALGGTFFEPTVLADVTPEHAAARRRRSSARWRRCSASRTRRRRSGSPTTPSSAWPPTSTRATSAASGAWPKRSSTAWSASTPASSRTAVAPFGGVKQSGLGREGSRYGIDEYLEIKYLCMGGLADLGG